MKALIFNSGVGNRMGDFTKSNHKSMARLANGETIFARQLRLLAAAGITDVIVTTGPLVEQLEAVAAEFPSTHVTFVPNDVYDQTNYIYSMYLARDLLNDDVLMLHGDLIFNQRVLDAILADTRPNLGAVNAALPQPEKDFKARVQGDLITEVSVSIHDDDCIAFQPLYKLSRQAIGAWLDRVAQFVDAGNTKVYAENALNEISREVGIQAFSYEDHFVNEIDTLEDQAVHSAALRLWDFDEQPVYPDDDACGRIPEILGGLQARKPLVVGGRAFTGSRVQQTLDANGVEYTVFSGYSPNPKLPEVLAGLELFRAQGCDSIISMGGGSAIDVAKCIKLLAATDSDEFIGFGEPIAHNIPHICIPTTAGTGSESTHFAVVYIEGEKNSVAHDSLVPDAVILEPELLRTLPEYHKKSSLLDALAQCVESMWAKGAAEQSRGYAKQGIELILANFFPYFRKDVDFDPEATRQIQLAANYSGKAINLTKTTAAHAMSYGLTSQFGIAHGHAAALCLRAVWSHYASLVEDEGTTFGALREALQELNHAFGVANSTQAIMKFDGMLNALRLHGAIDVDALVGSVNAERMGNSPVPMSTDDIRRVYEYALGLRSVPELTKLTNGLWGHGEKVGQHQLDELQTQELLILEQFDSFCGEHGLRYYLSEGSLLGAVRHGGFIPWDDDIDVMMPRVDYDRFSALVAAGALPAGLHFDSFATNPKHWTVGAKLQATTPSKFVQPEVAHVSPFPGPHIDIFMVDPVREIKGSRFDRQAYALRGLRRALFMSSGRSTELTVNLKARLPLFAVAKVAGSKTLQDWIVYFQTKFNSSPDSPYWANLCSYYDLRTQLFPKQWFGEGRRVSFEGITAMIPNQAEAMLAQIFGPDYMDVPVPMNARGEHNFYVQTQAPLDAGAPGLTKP